MNIFQIFRRKTLLEKDLAYFFKNKKWLDQALLHRSAKNSQKSSNTENNERLEYLGDAVLSLILGDLLMKTHPDADEGRLSKMRSALVSTKGLYKKACEFRLSRRLKISRPERFKQNPRILAGAFEAVIGAIYLDGGYSKVYKIVNRIFQNDLKHWVDEDYKTILQAKSQKFFQTIPVYKLLKEEGPSHQKKFFVQVVLDGRSYGRGEGSTKKSAEMKAAQKTLEQNGLFEE